MCYYHLKMLHIFLTNIVLRLNYASKATQIMHFIVVETCNTGNQPDRPLSTENSGRPGFFDLIDNDVTQKRGRMSKCVMV